MKLGSGRSEEDLISAYLLILVLEVAFTLIKANIKIDGLHIFGYNLWSTYNLRTPYAGDVLEVLNIFYEFFVIFRIKV